MSTAKRYLLSDSFPYVKISALVAVSVAAGFLVAGCTGPGSSSAEGRAADATAADVSSGAVVTRVVVRPGLEHVHGLLVQESGQVLAGTHEGLFQVARDGTATRVGPSRDDLMGLSAAADGRLLASGHPGAGSPQPDPLGLVSSTDNGLTWASVPHAKRSDYHALGAQGPVIASWDGEKVQVSTDAGATWREGARREVWSLSLNGETVWATGPEGLARSTDHGATFTPVARSPRLALATRADKDGPTWGVDSSGKVWARDQDSGWKNVATLSVTRTIAAITAADTDTAYLSVDGQLVRVQRT